jgi:hypothetical protein
MNAALANAEAMTAGLKNAEVMNAAPDVPRLIVLMQIVLKMTVLKPVLQASKARQRLPEPCPQRSLPPCRQCRSQNISAATARAHSS